MHSIQKFNSKYNISKLTEVLPELEQKLISNKFGEPTIDFSDPDSILLLNKALLKFHYQIDNWQTPKGYLIPPVPGRADYVSGIVDLVLSECEFTPDTNLMQGIDIGCGASGIYPIIFASEYGGRMLACDIDADAVKNVRNIIRDNPELNKHIEVVRQADPNQILHEIIPTGQQFEFTICNPPFYDSIESAQKANFRKEKNLGTGRKSRNFKGQINELIRPGGEKAFIAQFIKESFDFQRSVLWYSVLVSKKENMKLFRKLLEKEPIKDFKVIEMSRGNKTSRFIAWSFYSKKQRISWLNYRLKSH